MVCDWNLLRFGDYRCGLNSCGLGFRFGFAGLVFGFWFGLIGLF